MNVLAHIDSKIWAIVPGELNKMRLAVMQNPSRFDELAKNHQSEPQTALSGGLMRYGTVDDNGIAVIEIKDVLFNPAGIIDEVLAFYFGGTSTPDLMKDIDAAASNPAVTAVVFKVHSPGGDVFGINEAADKIAALSAKKPTVAYIYGYGASAAYFLAAKCREIVTDAQALIGSIGVVAGWADYTGFYEQMGIAYEEVTSGNAPFKRLDIRKPEHRAVFMSEINGIETPFIKSVARGRKVSVETVKNNFGAGAVMAGHLAVKAGMADRVGSFDEVIKELKKKKKMSAVSADAKGEIMSEKEKSFMTKFREFFGSDETKAILAEEENETPKGEKSVQVKVDTSDAEKKLADLQAQIAETRKLQVLKDADIFIESECAAGRLYPSEKGTFKAMFVQAATDDADSPLPEGASRLETLKENQAKRKSHGLTEEVVNAEANQVLFASGDKAPGETEKELLNKTPLGRAALTVIEGGQSKTAQAK